tara:strand:+ start:8389 stop:9054 length:666 start_codon:yes stop_codon:yes gene_type:complete
MPVLKRDKDVIHFIHIPKTGGTSVLQLLEENGWIAMKESHDHPHREIWEDYDKIWNYQFTVVRNPLDKIESSYFHISRANYIAGISPDIRFCKTQEELYNEEKKFLFFVNRLVNKLSNKDLDIGVDNNFFRPQADFIGRDTKVFMLEDIDSLVRDLKEKGYVSDDSKIKHYRHRSRVDSDPASPPTLEISLKRAWRISNPIKQAFISFYINDFETLGYTKI